MLLPAPGIEIGSGVPPRTKALPPGPLGCRRFKGPNATPIIIPVKRIIYTFYNCSVPNRYLFAVDTDAGMQWRVVPVPIMGQAWASWTFNPPIILRSVFEAALPLGFKDMHANIFI